MEWIIESYDRRTDKRRDGQKRFTSGERLHQRG